jgi:hypothetical protein
MNITFFYLMEIHPNTGFALTCTSIRGTMSAGRASASPCHRRGPFTTVAVDGININRAVNDIDAEQSGSVLTDVIIILELSRMLIIAEELIVAIAREGIQHGDPPADDGS